MVFEFLDIFVLFISMKKLKSKMALTVNELEQKKEDEKEAGLERERTSSRYNVRPTALRLFFSAL